MANNWQHQRTMTPQQYMQALEWLGLNPGRAARLLGISARTSYRYRDGILPVPTATALLLSSLIAHGDKPVVPAWDREHQN